MALAPPDQLPDDRLLVKNLQAGLDSGLEGLYNKYYVSLVSLARRFTKDQDSARDVVQEVFFRLWKQKNTLKITSSIKSYLFRAVRNQALNLLRDHPDWDSLKENQDTIPESDSTSYTLSDSDLDRSNKVKKAINNLPPRAKTIFELSRFEGLTYAEIAGFMKISEKTVENQMRIALFKLREWLTLILLFIFFEMF